MQENTLLKIFSYIYILYSMYCKTTDRDAFLIKLATFCICFSFFQLLKKITKWQNSLRKNSKPDFWFLSTLLLLIHAFIRGINTVRFLLSNFQVLSCFHSKNHFAKLFIFIFSGICAVMRIWNCSLKLLNIILTLIVSRKNIFSINIIDNTIHNLKLQVNGQTFTVMCNSLGLNQSLMK